MVRLRMSRPNSSVPSKWSAEGGSSASSKACCAGSYGASSGASTAHRAIKTASGTPMRPVGWRSTRRSGCVSARGRGAARVRPRPPALPVSTRCLPSTSEVKGLAGERPGGGERGQYSMGFRVTGKRQMTEQKLRTGTRSDDSRGASHSVVEVSRLSCQSACSSRSGSSSRRCCRASAVSPTHPLGCHRERIADRVVFEHVIAALVHGSGHERIASPSARGDDPAVD